MPDPISFREAIDEFLAQIPPMDESKGVGVHRARAARKGEGMANLKKLPPTENQLNRVKQLLEHPAMDDHLDSLEEKMDSMLGNRGSIGVLINWMKGIVKKWEEDHVEAARNSFTLRLEDNGETWTVRNHRDAVLYLGEYPAAKAVYDHLSELADREKSAV